MEDIEKLGAYIDTLREMSHYMLKKSVQVCMLYDKLVGQLLKDDDYVDDSIS